MQAHCTGDKGAAVNPTCTEQRRRGTELTGSVIDSETQLNFSRHCRDRKDPIRLKADTSDHDTASNVRGVNGGLHHSGNSNAFEHDVESRWRRALCRVVHGGSPEAPGPISTRGRWVTDEDFFGTQAPGPGAHGGANIASSDDEYAIAQSKVGFHHSVESDGERLDERAEVAHARFERDRCSGGDPYVLREGAWRAPQTEQIHVLAVGWFSPQTPQAPTA